MQNQICEVRFQKRNFLPFKRRKNFEEFQFGSERERKWEREKVREWDSKHVWVRERERRESVRVFVWEREKILREFFPPFIDDRWCRVKSLNGFNNLLPPLKSQFFFDPLQKSWKTIFFDFFCRTRARFDDNFCLWWRQELLWLDFSLFQFLCLAPNYKTDVLYSPISGSIRLCENLN